MKPEPGDASVLVLAGLLLGITACPAPPSDPRAATAAIEAVLAAQAAAWNAGDVERFMAEGYLKSDALVFTSGGVVRRGYEATLERYRSRYPDAAAMGELAFTDLEITLTAPTSAVALGRWSLERGERSVGGVFTLVLVRTDSGWRIVHDHTSVTPPESETDLPSTPGSDSEPTPSRPGPEGSPAPPDPEST